MARPMPRDPPVTMHTGPGAAYEHDRAVRLHESPAWTADVCALLSLLHPLGPICKEWTGVCMHARLETWQTHPGLTGRLAAGVSSWACQTPTSVKAGGCCNPFPTPWCLEGVGPAQPAAALTVSCCHDGHLAPALLGPESNAGCTHRGNTCSCHPQGSTSSNSTRAWSRSYHAALVSCNL